MQHNKIDFAELQDSLCYLHVSELKNHCEKLNLSTKGKKIALISRIIHFFRTGEKIDLPLYPEKSLAKGRKHSRIEANMLMLKGLYKNDLKTRLFFKNLIGEHFHFTAFGINWLDQRWMEGNPPTYREFADMWQQEYEFRKLNGSTPKEEWAYINFVKRYLDIHPQANRSEILNGWVIERNHHSDFISKTLY